ncbi:MAG: Gfo/Idh/MocA family oxidoreductase [Actinomycetota bacterium]|nr:Gfo/Idh/MocA family oxidoreductase [Actinomycetota bacterium]
MTEGSLRIGLVGCGRLAERGYAPAVRRVTGVEIVAVTDPNRARRGLLAKRTGASAHAQLTELLAAGPLDGVVICSEPESHEEAAAAVAAAGLTALVEKPPAPDAAGALRIAALTPAPWIGFNRRFDQGLKLDRRIPNFGELHLRLVLDYRRKSWRPISRGDDALLDLAPHLIDLALMLTGALPVAVRAQSERERAGIVMATTRGDVRIECATNRPHRELIEVRDAAGHRIARAIRGGRARGVVTRVVPMGHPLVRSLARQLDAYARALRGQDPGPLATAAEGAATMCVLDAARRSDSIGGETTAVEGVVVQT